MRLLFPRACPRISGHTDPQEGNCTHQIPQDLLLSPLPSTLGSGSWSCCILKYIHKVFYTFLFKRWSLMILLLNVFLMQWFTVINCIWRIWQYMLRLCQKRGCGLLLVLSLDNSLCGQPAAMTWRRTSIPRERPTQWGTKATCQRPAWSSNSLRSDWDGVMVLLRVNLTGVNHRISFFVCFQVGWATRETLWGLEGRREAGAVLNHTCFVVGVLIHPVNVMQGARSDVCV